MWEETVCLVEPMGVSGLQSTWCGPPPCGLSGAPPSPEVQGLVLLGAPRTPQTHFYHTAARRRCVSHGTAVLRVTKGEKRLQMNQTLVSPALLPGFESAQTEPRDNNTDFCRLLPYPPAPSAFPVNRPQEALNFHFAGNKTAVP